MESLSLLRRVYSEFRQVGARLIFFDVVFKLAAFAVLSPCVGLLFRAGLSLYGRDYLTDADIAWFFLHPIGLTTLIVVAGAAIATVALEYAVLFALLDNPEVSVTGAFRFAFSHAARILRLTVRITSILLAWIVPFLAISGLWYLLLLTQFDINYYLQQKPPEFWLAAALIGGTLLIPAIVVLRLIVLWLVALPRLLFRLESPAQSLSGSKAATATHTWMLGKAVLIWFLFHSLIGSVATGLVGLLAGWLLSLAESSLLITLLTMAGTLLIVTIIQALTSAFASATFSLLVWVSYKKLCTPHVSPRPTDRPARQRRLATWQWLGLGGLSCGIAGVLLWLVVESVPMQDRAVVMAHRGFSAAAPENTLAAIQRAIDAKADYVEIDVQETGDDKIVVIHDRDLKKIANVDLVVYQTPSEELRRHDVGSFFSAEFASERIPTLEEVLVLCRDRIKVNIELKTYGKDEVLVDRVVQLVEEQGMQDQIVIMSLKAELVRRAQAARPQWKIGQLVAVSAGDITRIDADFLAVSQAMTTSSLVGSVHRQGKDLYVWTVNDPVDMSSMLTSGVDGLITDFPDVAREVLEERSKLNMLERWLLAFGSRLEGIVVRTPASGGRPDEYQ